MPDFPAAVNPVVAKVGGNRLVADFRAIILLRRILFQIKTAGVGAENEGAIRRKQLHAVGDQLRMIPVDDE